MLSCMGLACKPGCLSDSGPELFLAGEEKECPCLLVVALIGTGDLARSCFFVCLMSLFLSFVPFA